MHVLRSNLLLSDNGQWLRSFWLSPFKHPIIRQSLALFISSHFHHALSVYLVTLPC